MFLARPLVFISLAVVLVSCGSDEPEQATDALPTLAPGALIPADPDTFDRVLASLDGQPVVVNFWATWCGPCKDEMPRLVAAARTYEGRVRFLGVDVEDADDAARGFIERHDIPFPSLADTRGEIRRSEQVVGLPTTQFYRADGELAFVHSGEIFEEDLEEKISELVQIGTPAESPE